MGGILNVGTRALIANQVALQTAGNNIANVNTPGYSRQSVVLQNVAGQFTGGGYIGKGVDIQTIQRNHSEFLTRQATLASATQYGDTTRADKLKQLQAVFPGGTNGLGAAVNDMLNAFSDVASVPTDLTARTVALTRVDETANRMRAASQSLDDLQLGVAQALEEKVSAINSLARNIAGVNDEIARAQGSGQPPNDLLDRRDQLVRELNQYVQTSSIPADDGTVGLFIGGSQALVLGTAVAPVEIVPDDFGDTLKNKLAINRNGGLITLEENTLGGGEISGLLRFQNTDLVEGRNLLGRLTLAITSTMNNQHKLGLDLNGNPGGNLFTEESFAKSVLTPVPPASLNGGNAILGLSISNASEFAASDYEVQFTSATTGTITRRSDGVNVDFPQTPAAAAPALAVVDGLSFNLASGSANAGDRYLIKPFSTAASNISSVFSTPRALAVASPLAGSMGTGNLGSLQLNALVARENPVTAIPVTLTFTGPNSYLRSDTGATVHAYVPGVAIEYDAAAAGTSAWALTLSGAPQAGDSFTVDAQPASHRNLNGGNAAALMNLRDLSMFDGAPLTDGYSGLISQIGVRTQSANYSAEVSSSIAANLEQDRTGISGVNLDEEAAKLLQYQQAYQASAKMIQIAQNIFDTLIQGMGR
jgi:flagellar hook-associated protein 1 FlgK